MISMTTFGAIVIALGLLFVVLFLTGSHTKKVTILGTIWALAMVCFGTQFFIGWIGTLVGYVLIGMIFILEHKL